MACTRWLLIRWWGCQIAWPGCQVAKKLPRPDTLT